MDNSSSVSVSSGFHSDVCVCGHAVARHVLAGTEYARCESYPGLCYCEGGIRVALHVAESVEHPNGTRTNARFFRKPFRVGYPHPLGSAIESAREHGALLEWAVGECDVCGSEWNEDFVPFFVDPNAEGKVQNPSYIPAGQTKLLCEECAHGA